jgi:hypothetical protein
MLKKSGSPVRGVADPRMEPTYMQTPRAGKIAEYIGVTVFKDHVNATWTDSRNGNQDVFGANWIIPLLEPRLILPADGDSALSNPMLFRWATSWKIDDDEYRFELANDLSFTSLVHSELVDSSSLNLVLKSQEIRGPLYWRVKTFKISTGDSSDYSEIRTIYTTDGCCTPPMRGNVDGLTGPSGEIDVADLSYLVDYLFKGGPEPPCIDEANVDGVIGPGGPIDVADLSYLVDYLFKGGPQPVSCP